MGANSRDFSGALRCVPCREEIEGEVGAQEGQRLCQLCDKPLPAGGPAIDVHDDCALYESHADDIRDFAEREEAAALTS